MWVWIDLGVEVTVVEHKEDCELGETGDEGNLKGCYGQTHSGAPMNCFCIIMTLCFLFAFIHIETCYNFWQSCDNQHC